MPFDDPEVCGDPGQAGGQAGEPPPASYGAAAGAAAAGAVHLSVLSGPDSLTCVSYAAVEAGKLLGAWREDGGGDGGSGGEGGGGGGRLCVALRRGHTCELHTVPLWLVSPQP